jgi:hypothetical protein
MESTFPPARRTLGFIVVYPLVSLLSRPSSSTRILDDAGVGRAVLEDKDADDSPPRTSGSIKLLEAADDDDVERVVDARLGRRRFHGEVDLPSAERKSNANRTRVEENIGIEIISFVSFITTCKVYWLAR